MNIDIDLKLLENIGLSADEFSVLYIIYRKGYGYLETVKFNIDWKKLEEKGYIKIGENILEHSIQQKFIDLFSNNFDSMFAELIETYPMKVRTTSGFRVLHATDPKAKSNLKAKNKYRKIVGNKAHIHQKIINLLNKQLLIERNNLAYLQNLETWINNHTWEKYEDIDCNYDNKNERRITRSL